MAEAEIKKGRKDEGFNPKLSGKRIKIMIMKSGDKHAIDPVPLSLNGHQITVKRGEKVDIPVEFLEILENATEYHYEQITNSDLSTTMAKREAPSYPYQVLGVAA